MSLWRTHQGLSRVAVLSVLLLFFLGFYRERILHSLHQIAARLSLTYVEISSPSLSTFHHRPMALRAVVVPPPPGQIRHTSAVMYHFAGLGGNLGDSWQSADQLTDLMKMRPEVSMWHVFLDASIQGRYSYFTDSPTNGPFETALLRELIPEIERRYLPESVRVKRFLTGHSSGGWVALWLMLHNPGFFDGVWATSPDPADFRDFFGVNIAPGSAQNMYRAVDGTLLPAARDGVFEFQTLLEYIEADLAGGGGDILSYEAAFSEKNPQTGAPSELFDRASGALHPAVLTQWQRFDLRMLLSAMQPDAVEKLKGRLNLVVGERDDFFL
ncbi:MAG: hypothetical protein EBZ48_13690 [Proteobacteria bacterium]|nr:hypothetical protein [Pseudomonadota bacterium]